MREVLVPVRDRTIAATKQSARRLTRTRAGRAATANLKRLADRLHSTDGSGAVPPVELGPVADGSLTIDGIFCPNESSCFGMLRALQDGKLAGKVKFVGFDSSSKLIEALEKGELNATVLQNPFNMGYLGVKTMMDVLAGKKVEKRVDTGCKLVTKDNMKEADVQTLLNPPLAQYLKE